MKREKSEINVRESPNFGSITCKVKRFFLFVIKFDLQILENKKSGVIANSKKMQIMQIRIYYKFIELNIFTKRRYEIS